MGRLVPFLYFTDHPEELGKLVTEGRREEFGHFSAFRDPGAARADPRPAGRGDLRALEARCGGAKEQPHAGVLSLYRELLALRNSHPALRISAGDRFAVEAVGEGTILMRRDGENDEALLIAINLRGESLGGSRRLTIGQPVDGVWMPVLATEERRFGGDGAWGRYEADSRLHVMQPGAVVLRSG